MDQVLEGVDHLPEMAPDLEELAEIEDEDDDADELERFRGGDRPEHVPPELRRLHPEEEGGQDRVEEEDEPEVPFQSDEEQHQADDDGDLEEDGHALSRRTRSVVLKCVLATLPRASRPCVRTNRTAAASTGGPAPLGRSIPHSRPRTRQPAQEFGPGQDRGGRDGRVLLAPRPLFELDRPALLEEGFADEALVPELVGHGPGARHRGQDVLDGPGVPPGQHLVEVPHPGVELVVFLRPDDDEGVAKAGLERLGDVAAALVRKELAVPDPELGEDVVLPLGKMESGHDERPEIIPLAGLVRADMAACGWEKSGLGHARPAVRAGPPRGIIACSGGICPSRPRRRGRRPWPG